MQRIALVEDNPDNRLLICALLEDDYDIDEYEDGQRAIDGIFASPPDLILLDISLPGMDGLEVLARLRASDFKYIPAIALTAHAMEGDSERFLAAGFNAYVSKPIVDEDILFNAISDCLGRTR